MVGNSNDGVFKHYNYKHLIKKVLCFNFSTAFEVSLQCQSNVIKLMDSDWLRQKPGLLVLTTCFKLGPWQSNN
jgi:hypothetical protein